MILRPHSKWEGVRGSSSPTSGNTYVGGGGRSLMIRIASISTMTVWRVIKSMNDRPKTFLIAVLVKPMVESSCGSSCAFLTDS